MIQFPQKLLARTGISDNHVDFLIFGEHSKMKIHNFSVLQGISKLLILESADNNSRKLVDMAIVFQLDSAPTNFYRLIRIYMGETFHERCHGSDPHSTPSILIFCRSYF